MTKSFLNLQFLQKLNCQKPCWDRARISSLVNKQLCRERAIIGAEAEAGAYISGEGHWRQTQPLLGKAGRSRPSSGKMRIVRSIETAVIRPAVRKDQGALTAGPSEGNLHSLGLE